MSLRTLAFGFLASLGSTAFSTSSAEAQIAFFPVVQPFQNGVSLDVAPVVSHDRRYVRMSLNFQSTAIEGFDTVSIPAAVGGTGNGGGFGFGGGGFGGGGRVTGLIGQPSGKSPWGNAPAPIAAAKGPSLSLDFPNEIPPTATASASAVKPSGPLLARELETRRGRSKSAKVRRN